MTPFGEALEIIWGNNLEGTVNALPHETAQLVRDLSTKLEASLQVSADQLVATLRQLMPPESRHNGGNQLYDALAQCRGQARRLATQSGD